MKLHNAPGQAPIVSLEGLRSLFGEMVALRHDLSDAKDRIKSLEALLA